MPQAQGAGASSTEATQAGANTQAATTNSEGQTSTTEGQSQKVVPETELQKVLGQLHKQKEEKRQLEEKLKAKEIDDIKKAQDWQKLAQLKEQEALDAKREADAIKTSYLNERKFSMLKEEAMKLGLRPEAISDLELLGLDGLQVETTSTGKINILGAKAEVEKLKMQKPHWFQSAAAPSVNSNSPGVVKTSSSFEAEVKAAKSQRELEQVMRKHGKI